MRATITGEVVETDRNEWNFNGKSGVAFALFVREDGASAAAGAQRVKVEAEQFGAFSKGEHVSLPVSVFANLAENGGQPRAKLTVTLDPEYVHSAYAPAYASSSSSL